MEALEGLLHLIAFLFRCAAALFDVLDLLQMLHGIVSFIADLMSRTWASISWFRRKPEPKVAPVARMERSVIREQPR